MILPGLSKARLPDRPIESADPENRDAAERERLLLYVAATQARDELVVTRLSRVSWMNGYLDGARPVDVLKTRGSAEVIAALDAAEAGAIG